MLSNQEKQELRQDALDQTRKKAFQKIKVNQLLSLDEYIQFLTNIQTIFPDTDRNFQRKPYLNQKL